MFIINVFIFRFYFDQGVHRHEQTPLMRVLPSGTHWSAVSTEAMRIKCLAQEHDILIQFGIEPSTSVARF